MCYISIKNQTENDNLNIIKKLFISKEELNDGFVLEENEDNFLISFFKKIINENYFYNNPNLLL